MEPLERESELLMLLRLHMLDLRDPVDVVGELGGVWMVDRRTMDNIISTLISQAKINCGVNRYSNEGNLLLLPLQLFKILKHVAIRATIL